jgi:hypothetical protein
MVETLVADIEAYRLAYNESYTDPGDDCIGLTLLVQMYEDKTEQAILWDKDDEVFCYNDTY